MAGSHSQEERASEARFAALLDDAESLRISRLRFDQLRELGQLYRVHAGRLARLRDRGDDPDAIRHLNSLCVRAYGLLYGSARRRWSPSGATRLGPALSRCWRPLAVAWALLLAGCAVGGALGARDPQALLAFVPQTLGYDAVHLEELWSSPQARARFLERDETALASNALFGSTLFAHNTQVGLLSLATGMLAGIPTVILQLYNGIIIGALGAAFLRDEHAVTFLAWILPHGVPELTAISLCAAAGLLLGVAVAAPGRAGRRVALREATDSALLLFGISVPLFFLAAIIESFVRESTLGTAERLLVAAVMALAVAGALLWLRGRARERRAVDWWGHLSAPVRIGARGSGSAEAQRSAPAGGPGSAPPGPAAARE